MKTIPKININSCDLSNQQSEIMSLWDIFNIPFRLKKLYISDIQLEIYNKETRIDILIIVFMYPIFY
jgi:hypothetical protein